jgi:hypothetical protein
MQPKPPTNKILMVDPIIPGKKKKKAPLKPPTKGKDKPYRMPRITDDRIIRTMPITEKQLGSIKKMYGIK